MGKGDDPNCLAPVAMPHPFAQSDIALASSADLDSVRDAIRPDDADISDIFPLEMGLESGRLYKFVRDGRIAGLLRADEWDEDGGTVMDPWLWVHPAFRRQGVGTEMLHRLSEIPHLRSCPPRVSVKPNNHASTAMVLKAGWVQVAVIHHTPGEVNGELDLVVFEPQAP